MTSDMFRIRKIEADESKAISLACGILNDKSTDPELRHDALMALADIAVTGISQATRQRAKFAVSKYVPKSLSGKADNTATAVKP